MPIYEYLCDACSHKLEAIQKFSDAPLKSCPECNEDSLRKLVSAAAFRLKGSGWYETDFKDKNKQKNVTGDKEAPTDNTEARSGDKESTSGAGKTDKKQSGSKKDSSKANDTKTGSPSG